MNSQLKTDIRQLIDDTNAIRDAVITIGIEVPDGTPSFLFADKVAEVYEKGKSEGSGGGDTDVAYSEGYEQGKVDSLEGRARGTEPSGDIVINADEIANYCFYGSPSLTGIELPNATVIGVYAFRNSHALAKISMPKVVEIDEYAFYQCTGLTELILPESIKVLGTQCLAHCKNLTTLIVKGTLSSVSEYSSYVFNGLSNLTDVHFEGVIEVDGINFKSSTKLTKESITNVIEHASATTTITITFSLTAVNKAFETSEGAKNGSTSEEWLALVATKPNVTVELA